MTDKPQQPEARDPTAPEWISGTLLPNTDDAPAALVLDCVRQCAQAWVPEARLLGNIRAGDIRRAIIETQEKLAASNRAGEEAEAAVSLLRDALTEIAAGKGAFSTNQLTHAGNVIEEAKTTAFDALAKTAAFNTAKESAPVAGKVVERDMFEAQLWDIYCHAERYHSDPKARVAMMARDILHVFTDSGLLKRALSVDEYEDMLRIFQPDEDPLVIRGRAQAIHKAQAGVK